MFKFISLLIDVLSNEFGSALTPYNSFHWEKLKNFCNTQVRLQKLDCTVSSLPRNDFFLDFSKQASNFLRDQVSMLNREVRLESTRLRV